MARVKATFKPDRKGFTEFACSPQMLEPLYEAAHDVRRIAMVNAPKKTGAYAQGFKVDASAGTVTIGSYKRVITVVVNQDPAAAPVEFGGYRNKAQHILGRAGAAVGDFRGSLPDD